MNKTLKEKNISNLVWCAKAIAILSVIVAHSDFQSIQYEWLLILIQRIGAMGVPVFLFLSAYYYRTKKYDSLKTLLKSRINTIIPWVVLSGACYLWSNLRTGKELGIQSFFQFFIGYNSFLYFLTVLILMQLLFWVLRYKNIKILALIGIILSVVSTELAAFGVTNEIIARVGLTNYLNVFNWIGFFGIGLYFQTKSDEEIVRLIKKYSGWAIIVWCILFVASRCIEHGQYGYFSVLGIFMEFASAILILRVAWGICYCKWIIQLGKYSFAVYLIHINIVPIVNKFLGGNMFGEIASPLCTYIISFLLIRCACIVLQKMKIGKLARYLLGVRVK